MDVDCDNVACCCCLSAGLPCLQMLLLLLLLFFSPLGSGAVQTNSPTSFSYLYTSAFACNSVRRSSERREGGRLSDLGDEAAGPAGGEDLVAMLPAVGEDEPFLEAGGSGGSRKRRRSVRAVARGGCVRMALGQLGNAGAQLAGCGSGCLKGAGWLTHAPQSTRPCTDKPLACGGDRCLPHRLPRFALTVPHLHCPPAPLKSTCRASWAPCLSLSCWRRQAPHRP